MFFWHEIMAPQKNPLAIRWRLAKLQFGVGAQPKIDSAITRRQLYIENILKINNLETGLIAVKMKICMYTYTTPTYVCKSNIVNHFNISN